MQPDVLRLANDLGRAPIKVLPLASKAVGDTLGDIKQTARDDAPRYSERYARSIDYDHNGLKGEVGPRSRYGHLVEDGGARSAPNPVMARATKKHEADFEDRMERALIASLW